MIINGYGEYKQLINRMNREPFVVSPIFRDVYYHREEASVLCVSVMFENREMFVISVSHEDATPIDISSNKLLFDKAFTADTANALAYIHGKSLPTIDTFFPPYIQETNIKFSSMIDSNRIVPITVWASVLNAWNNMLWDTINQYKDSLESPAYTFTSSLINTLKKIESSGLAVDASILLDKFGHKTKRYFKSNNKVYSEYNPFTTTGRPSNRYAGINFSALNKSDGSRAAFVSRYPDGILAQIDFEAYHLRLIANEMGIVLPHEQSIHTELAKIYFGVDEITEEMYAASKAKTFEIMYGMSDESFGFELFDKIHQIRQQYENHTKILLPSGIEVAVDTPNASKLFNYYVQSLEVVKTLPKLEKILDKLQGTSNHLILYTYDSILLDMERPDEFLLREICDVLEEGKKFPVRIYKGTNYDNIQQES